MLAHRATEHFSCNGSISQPSNFGVAVGAWVDITKCAGRTDRRWLRGDIATLDTFCARSILDDINGRALGVPILSDDTLNFGQPIGGELEVGIPISVSMRFVGSTARIDLDRRMCPEIAPDLGSPAKVGGGISFSLRVSTCRTVKRGASMRSRSTSSRL